MLLHQFIAPSNLSAIITNEALNLSWTGNGSSFDIYRNGEFLENVTKNIYADNSAVAGQYCYKIKAYSGFCESEFSDEVCEVILGVKDVIDNKLFIYPNPVKDELCITNYELRSGETIIISDLQGRIVINYELSFTNYREVTINVSTLPQGVYIVKIGNKTARIVKQ